MNVILLLETSDISLSITHSCILHLHIIGNDIFMSIIPGTIIFYSTTIIKYWLVLGIHFAIKGVAIEFANIWQELYKNTIWYLHSLFWKDYYFYPIFLSIHLEVYCFYSFRFLKYILLGINKFTLIVDALSYFSSNCWNQHSRYWNKSRHKWFETFQECETRFNLNGL